MENVENVLRIIWEVINSPLGVTVVVSAVAWGLSKLFTAKPLWKDYEGTILSAIKYAEKGIPDDAENKSLARLNAALRYAIDVYEKASHKKATEKEIQEIKEGIQIVHKELEKEDVL